MHGLDGQHQDMASTLRGRVSQNDRGQGQMEKVRPCVANPRIEDGLRTELSLMAGEMRRRLAGWLPAV